MATAPERREALGAVCEQASVCPRCPQLVATRQTVVFGTGDPDADLMFVGEAPGANEDEHGVPFVGQAGKLLDQLLGEIGLTRADVYVCNTLKCVGYTTQVQLGDGSWERIGRLVRSRYQGTVMSVDEAGRLVPRQVTGWHTSPLAGRSVYRLTHRSAKVAGRSRVSAELTGDHPVLTQRGYVRVDELTSRDRVATGQGLSPLAQDVVTGTLLGDASLSAKSASLTASHSARQADYASFKAELLLELEPALDERAVAAVAGGDPAYEVVHFRTHAHRALVALRQEFYDPVKAVPARLATELNARMLAFWFMDDGYTRIRAGRQPLSEIATNAFSDADRQILLRGLAGLGLPAKASRQRIFFDVTATRRLSEVIAPFVPASMRYKLHPEVEALVPFDRDALRPDFPMTQFSEVEVEDVAERPRTDTTFFCIDVAENHNFVTAGGVVHNCRPPQNRDPLPQELDNCQEYLFRQLELVEPRVVCTLGNFATKLLRGDPTGITKLRGQPEVRTIGPRTVRLYPILHPAAALYTRRLLDTLREDFARLPELLAMDPPPQPAPAREPEPAIPEPELAAGEEDDGPSAQLGLF